jgi:hypothetical protein
MLLARTLSAAAAPPRAALRRVAVLSSHLSAASRAGAAQQRPQRALRLVRVRRPRRSGAHAWRADARARQAAAADKPGMAAQAPSQPKSDRGHQAPAAAAPPDPAIVKLREHQSAAARQPFAEECRSLVALSRYGVLSTISIAKDVEGFPSGSIVGYADATEDGAPIFVFSTMSGHTRDVMADGRASLTVTAPGFEGAADARVCLTGVVRKVPEAAVPAARDRYLARHPDAFWVTFGAWHAQRRPRGC